MVVVVVSAVAGGRSHDFSGQKKLFIWETAVVEVVAVMVAAHYRLKGYEIDAFDS